jgi:hypothetical protein
MHHLDNIQNVIVQVVHFSRWRPLHAQASRLRLHVVIPVRLVPNNLDHLECFFDDRQTGSFISALKNKIERGDADGGRDVLAGERVVRRQHIR